ncbi:hypothetical protein F25303_6598 [Fusarium sp. NRRL 25303]|nr:hypothetical protein F25303_6598 [Fusarium sp. NRRL 25303]
MLTGFEALGAASAVLQVISFATDVVVACKNAYDGATTSQDALERYTGQMSEAVGRLHTRCEQMSNANTKFASPKLQNIAKECKDVADKLEAEVQYLTSMPAQGDISKSIHKSLRVWRHRKKLQALEESLSKYQRAMEIELTSYSCSQGNAMKFQQDALFGSLDTDIQVLVNQIAQGSTAVKDLVKREHAATRSAISREGARVEAPFNSRTDIQVLELRTTAETKRKCENFLQSLKTPRMNQRYIDVMDSRDASFHQVFATYKDMIELYDRDSEESGDSTDNYDPKNDDNSEDEINSGDKDDPQNGDGLEDNGDTEEGDMGDDTEEIDPEIYESSEAGHGLGYKSYMGDMDKIHNSWFSLNSWLKSDDKLFYIQGKPGSGKSTLMKFILNQDQTRHLIQQWSPDAIIISYFFWKIGSQEQNSIKGLWCSLLYQRLQNQQHLILGTLQRFHHLFLHSEYRDWSVKDLQDVWNYVADLDPRHICLFFDGIDEIQDKDGFPQLAQVIQSILGTPNTKLCVSTRPEEHITRWLKKAEADRIMLEELTRLDMHAFLQERFDLLLLRSTFSPKAFNYLCQELVNKAEGVFLWLHLATRSIIEGIENGESQDFLFARLHELPCELENLYVDLWERRNLRNSVYQETAARYFRYALRSSDLAYGTSQQWVTVHLPTTFQIACADSEHISKALLSGSRILGVEEIRQISDETEVSIRTLCAGLLEIRPQGNNESISYLLGNNQDTIDAALGKVVFIHRSAHDFLADTEEGQQILGRAPLSDFALHTRLLKSLISMVVASHTSWKLVVHARIIHVITCFAEDWGSEGLQVAMEMLDIVRPVYEKAYMRNFLYPWMPHIPFFSNILGHPAFERYVISRLRNESSRSEATSVLREGWDPDLHRYQLSKAVINILLSQDADAHEYGETSRTEDMIPFVREGTAFTNLLTSHVNATQRSLYKHDGQCYVQNGATGISFQISETAIRMAMTCQDLNATVLLLRSFTDSGTMVTMALTELAGNLAESQFGGGHFVVFEVNVQFLILYLMSRLSGDVAHALLGGLGAHGLISKLDSPSVKARYFLTAESTDDWMRSDEAYRLACQCIPSDSAALPGWAIARLFGVMLKGCSTNPGTSSEGQTDLEIISQLVDDSNTDEVEFEAAITSLAKERLGFCTYQDAGKIPTVDYLRSRECQEKRHLFPLTMGKLEMAASGHI